MNWKVLIGNITHVLHYNMADISIKPRGPYLILITFNSDAAYQLFRKYIQEELSIDLDEMGGIREVEMGRNFFDTIQFWATRHNLTVESEIKFDASNN